MKILVLGKVWPEPRSSAAGTRTLGLIDAFLQEGWTVTFATTAQRTEHSVSLAEKGVSTKRIRVNDQAFDHWVQVLAPDIVVFDRYMTEEQFGWRMERTCPNAIRVLDTIDLHCLREAREEQLKRGGDLNLFNDVAIREIAAIFRSDLSLMISEFEIDCLESVFQVPATQLSYLPLMLDAPVPSASTYEDRKDFVMIGNYLHPPNWDAVRWCCAEIWPAIRQHLPDAALHLYGSYEPEKARQLDNPAQGIHLCGRAENAMKTLEHYRINLAPLRFGAGQKGKVADGFCSGTPTVATPIAVESMNGPIPWGCPIHADAPGFASTAVEVYTRPELWKTVQQQGYRIVEERFLASNWAPRLIQQLESLNTEHRKDHFIGRMLRHHHHRSTEFMSRWIEAKNRLREGA